MLLKCRAQTRFPCDVSVGNETRYEGRTVWNLRPQDIDIVASLGDSITAGTGSKATNLFGVLNENRGSSYMTGKYIYLCE